MTQNLALLFTQSAFIEWLLCVEHYSRYKEYKCELNEACTHMELSSVGESIIREWQNKRKEDEWQPGMLLYKWHSAILFSQLGDIKNRGLKATGGIQGNTLEGQVQRLGGWRMMGHVPENWRTPELKDGERGEENRLCQAWGSWSETGF